MFIQLYVAKIMHGMHSRSVPTSMLAVLKLVKTLIAANVNRKRSPCAIYRFLTHKVVVSTQERSFWDEERMH